MRGIFISGTDTGVGKTAVSAGLLKGFAALGAVHYWKPIQTGTIEDDDTHTVRALTGLPADVFDQPTYRFRAPLSPHLAAAQEQATISLAPILKQARRADETPRVVEGAGGLLVPLAPGLLQIDLIRELGLPVLLVVADRLGAINHTLLSLEACRSRGIEVRGLVLNQADPAFDGNRESLEAFGGGVPVLGRFFRSTPAQLVTEVASLCDGLEMSGPRFGHRLGHSHLENDRPDRGH